MHDAKMSTKIMENKRFFAYGCSFTKYAWPTWADILGRNYSEYYNYGQYGAGNMYIFNALMESDQHHRITKDDLVIVQWSCSSREDRYFNGSWQTPGGVANFYSKEDLLKYFDFRGFVIRDLALIKAAKSFLDNIGCEYYFTAMVPMVTNNMYGDQFDGVASDVGELYSDVVNFIKPSYEDILGTHSYRRPKMMFNIKVEDGHPIPSEHYAYLKSVLPHLLKEPEDIAIEFDKKLSEIWVKEFAGWTYVWPDTIKGIKDIQKRL